MSANAYDKEITPPLRVAKCFSSRGRGTHCCLPAEFRSSILGTFRSFHMSRETTPEDLYDDRVLIVYAPFPHGDKGPVRRRWKGPADKEVLAIAMWLVHLGLDVTGIIPDKRVS